MNIFQTEEPSRSPISLPTHSPSRTATQSPTASADPRCIDFDCGEGYLLRENPEQAQQMIKPTCCFREGVCAGAPVGSPCSLGDIESSLIPNPSFEEFTSCPETFAQLDRAVTWVQTTLATSDYFVESSSCQPWSPGWLNIGQGPSDGDAFVGALGGDSNYFEYIGAFLISPLEVGVEYTLRWTFPQRLALVIEETRMESQKSCAFQVVTNFKSRGTDIWAIGMRCCPKQRLLAVSLAVVTGKPLRLYLHPHKIAPPLCLDQRKKILILHLVELTFCSTF